MVVTGTIRFGKKDDEEDVPMPVEHHEDIPLNKKDFYKELRLRGYNYG